MSNIVAILFIVAGIAGAAPVDPRIAWILVLVAGILMLFPV